MTTAPVVKTVLESECKRMYLYDDFDRTLVTERVAEFRDQVARRLSGELTEDEFKPLRLMNGVYLQLHAYMLRTSIPYGTLSSEQLRMLAHVARRYDRGYGHFTTRQNIQYHWIKLEELPDAMADLAISPPINGPALRPMSSRIRGFGPSSFASMSRCIRSFRFCRANSKLRSALRRMTARRWRSTIWHYGYIATPPARPVLK
jgi:hypothetical protein